MSVWSIPAMMPSIMGLQTRERTHREVYSTSNTSLAHATVKKKRVTVLLVQNSLDAEHLGLANDNEEHSARRNTEENQPGACHRRGRRRARQREGREEVRGVRLFLLFFLFLLLLACSDKRRARSRAAKASACTVKCSFSFSFSFSFSSSSSLLASNAEAVRKRREEESTTSPADPARTGRARVGRLFPAERRRLRSLRCGSGSTRLAGPHSRWPVGQSASRKPPPPLSSPPSVPVGRRASQAPHHGCDAGPRLASIRKSCRETLATHNVYKKVGVVSERGALSRIKKYAHRLS